MQVGLRFRHRRRSGGRAGTRPEEVEAGRAGASAIAQRPTWGDGGGTRAGHLYQALAAAQRAGRWEEAEAACAELLGLHPQSAGVHALLGEVCCARGLLPDAVEWYRCAVRLDPSDLGLRAKLRELIDRRRAQGVGPAGTPRRKGGALPAFGRSWLRRRQWRHSAVFALVGMAVLALCWAVVCGRTTGRDAGVRAVSPAASVFARPAAAHPWARGWRGPVPWPGGGHLRYAPREAPDGSPAAHPGSTAGRATARPAQPSVRDASRSE